MTTSLELQILRDVPAELYQELDSLTGGTVFHTAVWHKLLQQVFSWQVHAIIGRGHDGRLLFFMPYVSKMRMARRVHVCLPLAHAVGPAYHPNLDLKSVDLRPLIWPIEIHADVPLKRMVSSAHHYSTELDLTGIQGEDGLLRKLNPAKRRKINTSEREGVKVYPASSPEHYAHYADLQAITRKRQGAPGYPRNFFPIMAKEMAPQGLSRLYLAEYGGKVVAGVIFMHFRQEAIYAYGASLSDRNMLRLGVNQAVMWCAIRDAWKCGCSKVDFGSTPVGQDELRRYKEQFGGVSRKMIHTYGSDTGLPLDTPQDGALAKIGGLVLQHMPLPLFKQLSPLLLRMVV